jgi:polysaccharide export outer membrane protein
MALRGITAFGTLLSVAMLLGGCSTPGRNFSASLPSSNVKQRYSIKAITPKLLVNMAHRRAHHPRRLDNAPLQRAIDNWCYRVGPQDVLNIVIWGHPELTLPQGEYRSAKATGFIVHSDGTIFYPYVGSVQVAGKTTAQIRDQLAKALKPFVKNPQVDVKVVGFNSKKFELAGAVVKPGLYPITNVPVTVAQAIAKAGGAVRVTPNGSSKDVIPRPLADLSNVVLVRQGERTVLNLRAFYRHGEASQNRLIRPGDIIQIPDNANEQIHLIGEVRDPGNYPMNHGELNLAQALGSAGGLNLKTANASRIFVFRGAYNRPRVFWLNAGSPDAMLLAAQFQLQPQDVVYVATAGISSWNRIVTQILPTVQALYETKVLVNP